MANQYTHPMINGVSFTPHLQSVWNYLTTDPYRVKSLREIAVETWGNGEREISQKNIRYKVQNAISRLRQIFGEDVIITVYKRGYRMSKLLTNKQIKRLECEQILKGISGKGKLSLKQYLFALEKFIEYTKMFPEDKLVFDLDSLANEIGQENVEKFFAMLDMTPEEFVEKHV